MAAQYTLIMGTQDWSSWSLRPYLALRATGAPFEQIVIPLRQPDSKAKILRHSHSGYVPALKIAEAGKTHTVWDSLAICETLAERHPAAKLWPDDPFVRAEARSYAAEMHSGFAAVRANLSMDFARRVPTPALDDETKQQVARIIDAWTHALTQHGDANGFLFGRFSVADCMYGPVVSRFRTYGIATPPIVGAYMERMFALPAMHDWDTASKAEVDAGLA
ncbi:MAG: glutathione S-transferase family protein [Rhizomicrobium sp.]